MADGSRLANESTAPKLASRPVATGRYGYAHGRPDTEFRPSSLQAFNREQRAYRLVVAGGVAGAVAVVGLVLAIVGVIGYALPVLALVIAVICAFLFRRSVS